MDQQKQSCPRIQDVISNIGFVPGTFKDNVLIPVEPNGLFRERYPSKNTTKPYPHEGVDFGAAYGTDIYDKDSDAYTYPERLRNPFNREHNWKTDL